MKPKAPTYEDYRRYGHTRYASFILGKPRVLFSLAAIVGLALGLVSGFIL